MQNDIELLDLMLRDQDSQTDVYRPGPYWKPYGDRTIKAIRSVGIENFRGSRTISKGFGEGDYPDPFDPVLLTSLKGRLFSRILTSNSPGVNISHTLNPDFSKRILMD